MYELFFRHAVSDTLQDPRNGCLVICRRLVIPYSLDVPSGKRRVVRGRRIPSTLHDTVIKLLTRLFPLFPLIIIHIQIIKRNMCITAFMLPKLERWLSVIVRRSTARIRLQIRGESKLELKVDRIFLRRFPFQDPRVGTKHILAL